MSNIKLIDLCKFYKGLSYQMAAISELEEAINKANPHILGREQAWFKTWSQVGKQASANPLPTPYQSQRDNYRDAWRTCFSSSCAMLLMTLKPGVIHSDDEYIKTVFSIGDTTNSTVQIKALQHYGVSARFKTNGNRALVQQQIDAGKPVPAGFLHHGTANAPSGRPLAVHYWLRRKWLHRSRPMGRHERCNRRVRQHFWCKAALRLQDL